ncbi:MAG: hypothetical protein Q8M31_21820 [Beijerinckiaceae bacterium]|nr:hypothetical protein [Beijerinckiaceae bacterium]
MSGQKVSKFGQANPDRLIRFLRGVHPTKTAENVAGSTGLPVSTVRKWLDGSSAPGFIASWSLIGAYGLPIIAAAFETKPKWIDDDFRARCMRDLDAREALRREEHRSLIDR